MLVWKPETKILLDVEKWGGCSSVGRAGRLAIVSEILNPTLLISEGPAMSWRLVQGVPCHRPETRLGFAPAATSRDPMERDKLLRTMT